MHDYEVTRDSDGNEELLVLLDFYPVSFWAFFVLQSKKGTLADLIKKMEAEGKHIAEDVILKVFLGVCTAVRELHSSTPPLAHRDLKVKRLLRKLICLASQRAVRE